MFFPLQMKHSFVFVFLFFFQICTFIVRLNVSCFQPFKGHNPLSACGDTAYRITEGESGGKQETRKTKQVECVCVFRFFFVFFCHDAHLGHFELTNIYFF